MTISSFRRRCLSLPGVYPADVNDILKKIFRIPLEEEVLRRGEKIDEAKAEEIIAKLSQGVPSAYLIGEVDFAGLTLFVTPDVLIPRMETEEMVLRIVEERDLSGRSVLDLCAGSGCIGLALAKAFPQARVTLSDISPSALSIARKNGERNGIENAEFVQSDWLDGIENSYDLIVSNPPYIPSGTKTLTSCEPPIALFSGESGLDSYASIFPKIRTALKPGGEAFFEVEDGKQEELKNLLLSNRLNDDFSFSKDLSGKVRFLHIAIESCRRR